MSMLDTGTFVVFGLVIVLPAVVAKFVIGASWIQLAIAFPTFWLVLFLVLGFGTISSEVAGFTVVMSMFFGWIGVPLTALALRLADIPNRLF